MSEIARRRSAKVLVLEALQRHRTRTNLQLNEICFRYGARIHELRKEGHGIERYALRRGVYEYRYLGFNPEPLDGSQLGLFDVRPYDD